MGFKSQLKEYQRDIVIKALNAPEINGRKNFLVCAKPGLGKTAITIALCYKLIIDCEIDKVIWASPANLISNLHAELDKHLDESYHRYFSFISHEKLSLSRGLEELNNRVYLVIDECYHPETKILTTNGWVRMDEITMDDKVAQYTADGIVEFVYPERIIKKHYNGNLIRFGNKKFNYSVTPNHDVVVENSIWNKSEQRYIHTGKLKKIQAKNLYFKQQVRLRYGTYPQHETSYTLSAQERMHVCIQADGTMYCTGKLLIDKHSMWDKWRFEFSKQRKIDNFLDILKEGNFVWKEGNSNRKNVRRFYVYNFISCKLVNKTITLDNLQQNHARSIIEEMVKWDGNIKTYSEMYEYNSTIKDNVDFYQAVSFVAGYRTLQSNFSKKNQNHANIHRLLIRKHQFDGDTQSEFMKEEYNYNGNVYCVTVPSGMIVVSDGITPIVCGNCHRLKNTSNAKRSFYTIRESVKAYGTLQLTGTPKGAHYNSDLYGLLLLLGYEFDRLKFDYRFCVKSKMRYISSKNTEQLMAIIEANSIWVDKSVLNLPDKNHHIIDVPISNQMQKLATDMAIHGEATVDGKLVKKGIQTLLLLNSGYICGMTEDGNFVKYINSKKPEALIKLLKQLGNEQVLIFCTFHVELEAICGQLTALGLSYVVRHGKQTVELNNEACKLFVGGDKQILLTTIASSEMGLTFTNCKHTIYYNITQSPTQLEQSQDRTHRFGQEQDCQYYYLSAGNLNHGLIEIQLNMIRECDRMFKLGGDIAEFDLSKTMKKLAERTVKREEPITKKVSEIKLNVLDSYKFAFEDIIKLSNAYYAGSTKLTTIGEQLRGEIKGLEIEYNCKLENHKEIFEKANQLSEIMKKTIQNPDLLPAVPPELSEYESSIYSFLSDNNSYIPVIANQVIGDEAIKMADIIPLLFIDNQNGKLIICDWTLFAPSELTLQAQKRRLAYRNAILMARTKLYIKDNIFVQFTTSTEYLIHKY